MQEELEQIEQVYHIITEFLVNYSFQLFGALVIFLIGLYVAKKVAKLILNLCSVKKVDITLSNFVANFVKILIIVMVAIICLGKLGISVTPFVAAVGAISLGAGLAVQGLLSNYAAGMTIIVIRPFVVGNTIEVNSIRGQVKEIKLAATILTNEDGEIITIPNKHIVGEVLHNSFEYSLVNGVIGVSYADDPEQAQQAVLDALLAMDAVASEPAPHVGIENFADSGIEIGYRYWVPTCEYHQYKYQANLAVFRAIQQGGFDIPFPQREIKML